MNGVLYAAIGVALVVGLAFVLAYSRRGSGSATPSADRPAVTDGDALDAARRVAEAEIASLRQLAARELDAERRQVDAELAAARRQSEADAADLQVRAHSTRERAESQAQDILAAARRSGADEVERLTATLARTRDELAAEARQLEATAAQLTAREAEVDRRSDAVDRDADQLVRRRAELDRHEADLAARARELAERADRLEQAEHERIAELARVAGLSVEQARTELLAGVEAGARREAASLVRSIENEARAEGTTRARAIVAEAVQRVASDQTTETVVSVLALPGDEMKGRIIGREGRNIRAFESVTGVNVIIDDTPEAVLLSCFDPVRRETGRLTLEKLVLDGRIHPHRIEEVYEASKAEVEQLCLRAAADALAEVGINDLDEHLVPYLGRLKYRTSYGQNVLGHLIETAHIAGVMAAELGVDPVPVKRSAFLHDIGKALTHEVEGSHAIIGADLLRRFGEHEDIAHAVEAHHNEVLPRTVEAVLTQASDSCSAARPGARRESLESYVKRLARIEEIASTRVGVDKVFAMQAGREVRVMVQPGEVDDLGASVLAREIAKQIEDELTYPGQIRVTVVRETRSTEVAH